MGLYSEENPQFFFNCFLIIGHLVASNFYALTNTTVMNLLMHFHVLYYFPCFKGFGIKQCFSHFNVHTNHLKSESDITGLRGQSPAFVTSSQALPVLLVPPQTPRSSEDMKSSI